MFRNRTTSQKPNDDLYQSFRHSYPHLVSASRPPDVVDHGSSASHIDALDVAHHPNRSHFEIPDDLKDQVHTPRGHIESLRLTPSLLDPNSFAFTNLANQPPGYYTPTPGGINTLYHSQQAGDLHTPGLGIGLGTPLSLPTSEGALHAGQTSAGGIPGFHPQGISPEIFQNPNPFAMQHQSHGFVPHGFAPPQSSFEQMEQSLVGSPLEDLRMDPDMEEESPTLNFSTQSFAPSMGPPPPHQSLEQFRFHATLNAPTAMVKTADEIPVTYLNKGQPYSLSIVDAYHRQPSTTALSYRTFVRVSFEDDQQRQRPAACWQLWKEGRGTNEAHQRGGRLQAVEFVDANQVSGGDPSSRPRIELESSSFDGFCVRWSPAPNSTADCSIAVRFNFLSTDFSHSKGVKGIPVRLCAKTEPLESQALMPHTPSQAEVCYCKVKLFRDHGAERKLSNDTAHVKKTIEKLKQQIAQVESGVKDFGKRKRSTLDGAGSSRPGKVLKHRRTWSTSSANSGNQRSSAEEELQMKLEGLQNMFSSQRPTSVLALKGDEQDDPDLCPVHLQGGPAGLSRADTGESGGLERQSSNADHTNSIVSPTPSSMSIPSAGRRASSFQAPNPFNPPSRMSSNDWRSMPTSASLERQPTPAQAHGILSDVPTKIQSGRPGLSGSRSESIEAIGVDASYRPPAERVVKPIACFYILPQVRGRPQKDTYYRAIYLYQRTLKDLVNAVAAKSDVEPTRITRTIRLTPTGLPVLLDDESVFEIPEGQDMVTELQEVDSAGPVKKEWGSGPTEIQVDGEVPVENVQSVGYELVVQY